MPDFVEKDTKDFFIQFERIAPLPSANTIGGYGQRGICWLKHGREHLYKQCRKRIQPEDDQPEREKVRMVGIKGQKPVRPVHVQKVMSCKRTNMTDFHMKGRIVQCPVIIDTDSERTLVRNDIVGHHERPKKDIWFTRSIWAPCRHQARVHWM